MRERVAKFPTGEGTVRFIGPDSLGLWDMVIVEKGMTKVGYKVVAVEPLTFQRTTHFDAKKIGAVVVQGL